MYTPTRNSVEGNRKGGNKSFTFGLPVLTKDNQVVSGKINLWLQVGDELPENLLLMLRGQQAINKFDIASEIRDDLLGKVLSLDINSHTYEQLRGNRELLETIASSIQREISSSLTQFGLFVQDCSVSYGNKINVIEIVKIDENSYKEKIIAEDYKPRSNFSFQKLARHHISSVTFKGKTVVAMDGKRSDIIFNRLINFIYRQFLK
mgnify:CR=1 FL=1